MFRNIRSPDSLEVPRPVSLSAVYSSLSQSAGGGYKLQIRDDIEVGETFENDSSKTKQSVNLVIGVV